MSPHLKHVPALLSTMTPITPNAPPVTTPADSAQVQPTPHVHIVTQQPSAPLQAIAVHAITATTTQMFIPALLAAINAQLASHPTIIVSHADPIDLQLQYVCASKDTMMMGLVPVALPVIFSVRIVVMDRHAIYVIRLILELAPVSVRYAFVWIDIFQLELPFAHHVIHAVSLVFLCPSALLVIQQLTASIKAALNFAFA